VRANPFGYLLQGQNPQFLKNSATIPHTGNKNCHFAHDKLRYWDNLKMGKQMTDLSDLFQFSLLR
jgi:hypothetical protein